MSVSLLSAFDLEQIDSAAIDLSAPEWFARQVSQHISTLPRNEPQESAAMQEHNELRLRLLSNAILAVNLLPADKPPVWAGSLSDWLEGRKTKIGGPVFLTPSGLSYMLLDTCMVTVLADLKTAGQVDLALDELSEIHHLFPMVTYWIFDMSALTSLPQSLVAYLIGFQHAENPHPPRLMILWLRPEALPKTLASAVMKYFHLMRKGAFLLSKF